MEFFGYGLMNLLKDDQGIYWLEENDTTTSLVVMPRLVEDVLEKEVFSQNIPFVFSSATLSQGGDFTYLAESLGISDFDSFTVASPFDYEENMKLNGHIEQEQTMKWEQIGAQLKGNHGHTLVLFSSEKEMNQFRKWADTQEWDFRMLYEGEYEISATVRKFQKEASAVLCTHNLWEGLDVPGEALTQVIISSLPFPPKDPVFQAKRKHGSDPIIEVDLPYMLLRLRQGIGRLIRTTDDHGVIQLWMTEEDKTLYQKKIDDILPVEMNW